VKAKSLFLATAAAALLVGAGIASAGKNSGSGGGATQFPGSLELVAPADRTAAADGAIAFAREEVASFNASYGKTPQNKVPWVETRCVLAGGRVPAPGTVDGDPIIWFGRGYSSPYAVVLGDAGGTSLWQNMGYPKLTCQAFLFLYYDVKNVQTVALFGAGTPAFSVG
jgi:hypothetical protein